MTCPGCGKNNNAYSSKKIYETGSNEKKKKYYRCQECSKNYKTIYESKELVIGTGK